MKSSVEKLSETRVKLTVNVPFDELGGEIDRAYAAIAQQVMIPGFRRGKAPRQLIDARFGRGPILEQVVNDMLPQRYSAAIEENDVTPLGQPEVDVTEIEDGSHVEFTAEVDVRPEITVPDFSTYEVEVAPLEVSEEAVDHEINHLRERFGELKNTDRELAEGDYAVIDLTVKVGEEELSDLSSEGISYHLGDDELYEGLDAALTGLKADGNAEFTTTLNGGDHKGEEAAVAVHVQQTKERVLPEVDEEFVQMASEFDTVEELRDATRTQVEEGAKAKQAAAIRDEVLKRALEEASFPLPEGVVEEQLKAQRQQLLGQIGNDEALLTQVLEAQGTSREDFDKEQRESAEQAVRTQLFLDALAEKEQPEVSQEELTQHILFTAQSYGMDPNTFVQQISQSGQVGNLYADMRRGKALAAAILATSVKDTDGNSVDVDELFGDEEEPEAEAEAETTEAPEAEDSDQN